MDPETVEKVERELDRFVERRAREARDAERVEELWEQSARRDLQRRREQLRQEWHAYHLLLAGNHANLAAEHEEKAAQLAGEQGAA